MRLKILDSSIIPGGFPISIIGNSGVTQAPPEGKLVRFNNYATRAGIAYTKNRLQCDVLFTTFDLHSFGSRPKHVVIGVPFPFKAENIIEKSQKWYKDSELWMVNPYDNLMMCKEMGIPSEGYRHPFPSIGFTALWHMKDWKRNVYIDGFNWYYQKDTGLFQGFDLRNPNKPTNWNHNYHGEIEWVIKNLRPKNNIKFSDECNRILDIASKQLAI